MRHTKHNLKNNCMQLGSGMIAVHARERGRGFLEMCIYYFKALPQTYFLSRKKKNETINADVSGYFHENNYIFVSVQFLHPQLLIY